MTIVSHESFLGRMANSVCGVFVGLFVFLGAIALTFWNEGSYVSAQEVLQSARSNVNPYACDDPAIPKDSATLVFLHGCALQRMPTWTDGAFEMETQGVWFETQVEMYQWKESEHSETRKDSVGGGKTTLRWYEHQAGWYQTSVPSPAHCDQRGGPNSYCDMATACSAGFGFDPPTAHCNPALPTSPANGIQYAPEKAVRAGAVFINRAQMEMLETKRTLMPTLSRSPLQPTQLPITVLDTTNAWREGSYVTSRPVGGAVRIGDVRVSWYTNAATSASVLAAVDAESKMVPWHSGVTAKVSGLSEYVNELQEGDVTQQAFFATLQLKIDARVWVLRILCFLLFYFGFNLFVAPLAVAPDIVPCIGPLIGDLVEGALRCACLVVALVTFLVVTALCWLWFRPLVGLLMLLVAAALIYGAVRLRRGARAKKLAQQGTVLQDGNQPFATSYQGQVCGAAVAPQPQMPYAASPMPYAASPMPCAPMAVPMGPSCEALPMAQPVQPVAPMGLPVAPMGQPVAGAESLYPRV